MIGTERKCGKREALLFLLDVCERKKICGGDSWGVSKGPSLLCAGVRRDRGGL